MNKVNDNDGINENQSHYIVCIVRLLALNACYMQFNERFVVKWG